MSIIDNPMAFQYSGPRMKHISCERCHMPQYPGAKAYKWQNKTICEECFQDAYKSLSASDVADLMGVEEINVEDEA